MKPPPVGIAVGKKKVKARVDSGEQSQVFRETSTEIFEQPIGKIY
jgi:hypothetical protein